MTFGRSAKILSSVILLMGGAFLLVLSARYLALGQKPLSSGEIVPAEQRHTESNTQYKIEEFVSGLEVPWSMVWTSPERMLVAERVGEIREVKDGLLNTEPLVSFTVSSKGEEGLMGLAVDPGYKDNKYLYACFAHTKNNVMVGSVARLSDQESVIIVDKILIDDIPSAQYHAGCRLMFGPDGKLYITTGDATEKELAQRIDSLAGKILRLNSDGTIPDDNPFLGSPVWSYGHRNPQGIAIHPETGELYETEHGPSIIDGPSGGDEVNRIVRGGNYGWPLVSHEKRKEGTVAPLLIFTPAEAPASAAFYSGVKFPGWKNSFFFGALAGEGIVRVQFDNADPDKVLRYEKLPEIDLGRIRAIAEGPDGYLYFSTSNRDGRGDPAPTDDRIFRIRPNKE